MPLSPQIRELFNQAGLYAYEQNPGENSYGRPVDENKYEEDRYTKFAELIVEQCFRVALIEGKGYLDPVKLRNEMKQNFGVEK